MTTPSKLDILFSPFTSGALTLKNRLLMAPLTRQNSPGGILESSKMNHYLERANGGVGLIISEGTCISNSAHGYPNVPSFYGELALQKWQELVSMIHQNNCKIIPQLWHVGSIRSEYMGPAPGAKSYAPSAILHSYVPATSTESTMPTPMTQQDIDNVIEDYTKAAVAAKSIGCDGIELHGAHGYLIDQFFWSKTNKRRDQYGGNIAQRTRFAYELIKNIRQAVGEFPIILRISQWKLGDYLSKNIATPQELEMHLKPLTDAGVDIFHCSSRKFNQPEFKGSKLSYAAWVKRITGKPVIAVGGIASNLDDILEAIDKQEVDLAALGRPLLSDPNWPKKIRSHRFDDIIPYTEY